MHKNTLLKKYKKLLGLQDWMIWLCVDSPTSIKFNLKRKEAIIKIAKGDLPFKDYWLLHELYHICYPHKREIEINKLTSKHFKF